MNFLWTGGYEQVKLRLQKTTVRCQQRNDMGNWGANKKVCGCRDTYTPRRNEWACEGLCCSDNEMVFRILTGGTRAKSGTKVSRVDINLFRGVCGRIPWVMALESRWVQESCLTFKNHLLQTQEWFVLTCRNQIKTVGGLQGWPGSSWLNPGMGRKCMLSEQVTQEEYRDTV